MKKERKEKRDEEKKEREKRILLLGSEFERKLSEVKRKKVYCIRLCS